MPKISKKQQRIDIAKDVLALIKAKTIISRKGMWGHLTDTQLTFSSNLKDHLDKGVTCECCALGACFIAQVNRNNGFDLSRRLYGAGFYPYIEFTDIKKRLIDIFGADQLALIEFGFEGHKGGYFIEKKDGETQIRDFDMKPVSVDLDLVEKAANYNKGLRNPTKRLVRVMNNIIRNKGEFVP